MGREKGAMLTLAQVWQLAKRWYRDRMSPEFRGRTMAEALTIFRELGLIDDFWLIPTE